MKVMPQVPLRTRVACALGATVALLSRPVFADAPPTFDVRTFRPSIDPRAGLSTEPATTQGAWVPSFATFLHLGARPVDVRRGTERLRLESVLGTDFVTSIGIGERVALGASMPISIVNVRAVSNEALSSTRPSEFGRAVPTSAVGDLAFHGKVTLRSNADGGFGVAAVGALSIPTGDPYSFASEKGPTALARALFDYDLYVGRLSASVGFKLRGAHESFESRSGLATLGNEVPWSFGIGFRPSVLGLDHQRRQEWEIGLRGSFPAGPTAPFGIGGATSNSASVTPVLLSFANRFALGHERDFGLLLGIDLGLSSAIGTPSLRTIVGVSWAPQNHDRDGDGVPDDSDLCPPIPEDVDGFEDSDGCPEIDDDDDGIVDRDDACPRVPGAPSVDPKANGCPAPRTLGP